MTINRTRPRALAGDHVVERELITIMDRIIDDVSDDPVRINEHHVGARHLSLGASGKRLEVRVEEDGRLVDRFDAAAVACLQSFPHHWVATHGLNGKEDELSCSKIVELLLSWSTKANTWI